jgi:hypothetical protein
MNPVLPFACCPTHRTRVAPFSFQLVTTCEPLDLGRVEHSGFDVRVELWGSDYCADHDPPRTHTKELGVLPSGRYTVDFYYCADLPAPDSYQCFQAESQGFNVTAPIPRPIPFALPATLLVLPIVLLLVASRMLRRR